MAVAQLMSSDNDIHTGERAFHSQQAAEKALKAAIASTGTDPEWIHNLVSLARELPPGWSAGASESDLSDLSRYAVAARMANPQ